MWCMSWWLLASSMFHDVPPGVRERQARSCHHKPGIPELVLHRSVVVVFAQLRFQCIPACRRRRRRHVVRIQHAYMQRGFDIAQHTFRARTSAMRHDARCTVGAPIGPLVPNVVHNLGGNIGRVMDMELSQFCSASHPLHRILFWEMPVWWICSF